MRGYYNKGPDRTNKLSTEKPKGLRGWSHGPAGPVKTIMPAAVGTITPPRKPDPEYAAYCSWVRKNGGTPKPPHVWEYKRDRKRARYEAVSPEVKAHRKKPYEAVA